MIEFVHKDHIPRDQSPPWMLEPPTCFRRRDELDCNLFAVSETSCLVYRTKAAPAEHFPKSVLSLELVKELVVGWEAIMGETTIFFGSIYDYEQFDDDTDGVG